MIRRLLRRPSLRSALDTAPHPTDQHGALDRQRAANRVSAWLEAQDGQRVGSLLIFVPRDAIGVVIDKLTGSYGYSHLAIDCGTSDTASGKPLMIEATAAGVHSVSQEKYGERKFVRIPLKHLGIDVDAFCRCVRSKLGETYDDAEALTFGIIDNPAKQICSDLVTICLPEEVRADMAQRHIDSKLHPRSAVRVYGRPNVSVRLFVSPNGFAEYLGAPRGGQITRKGQLSEPPQRIQKQSSNFVHNYRPFGIAILGSLALLWLLRKRRH